MRIFCLGELENPVTDAELADFIKKLDSGETNIVVPYKVSVLEIGDRNYPLSVEELKTPGKLIIKCADSGKDLVISYPISVTAAQA